MVGREVGWREGAVGAAGGSRAQLPLARVGLPAFHHHYHASQPWTISLNVSFPPTSKPSAQATVLIDGEVILTKPLKQNTHLSVTETPVQHHDMKAACVLRTTKGHTEHPPPRVSVVTVTVMKVAAAGHSHALNLALRGQHWAWLLGGNLRWPGGSDGPEGNRVISGGVLWVEEPQSTRNPAR